jgi:hypothetical protein
MNKNIKNFSEFESTNEGWDLGSIASSLGTVGADLVKSKVIEYLYGYIGVTPKSLIGTMISKLVQTIDFSEYWDIITGGGEFPVSKLAPKLADATMEIIAKDGIDGIAAKMNSSLDQSGLIYRAFEEMISNQARKSDFRENLITMWTWILTAGGGNSSSGSSSGSSKKNPLTFTKAEAKTLAKDPAVKNQGLNMNDLIKNFTGSSASTGTTEGQ